MGVLLNYSWPGNIRELQNAFEHAVLLSPGGIIDLKHLPADITNNPEENRAPENIVETSQPLRKVKDDMIRKTLEMTGGNISEAARKLEIGRSTLWRRLREMDHG
jgi:transcriptional regulator of acetoin/glycerol metabolism